MSCENDQNNRDIAKTLTLVTGSNSAYVPHLMKVLENLYSVKKIEETQCRVLVYDLGLSEQELSVLKDRYAWCTVMPFDFNRYPEHVSLKANVGKGCSYAWKPIIIHEVCETYGGFVHWFDTRNRYESFTALTDTLKKHAIYTPVSSGNIAQWTYPSVMRLFNAEEYASQRCRAAGIFAVDYDIDWCRELVGEWMKYALQKEYICPEGSDRTNHRQDQAILSILYYKYWNIHKFAQVNHYLSLKCHCN